MRRAFAAGLGLGALLTPLAHYITTVAIGRSWVYGKES